jgi:PAS domain S-box-containing protein
MQDISARKQAQATLQESEERYRGIVNNVVDAIFILDLQGRFLAVNDQACRRYGYDRETFLTLHIRDIDMPDDAVNVPQRLALLQREGAASFEAVHQDAQGCPIPVEVRATKSLFDGKPCMLSVVRDISERKRAEAALAEREEQLRLFIEHAPVALAMLDHALRYVAASRRWLDDYVLGERDIVGRSHYEVFPNIRDSWKESNRRALAGEVIRSEEDRYERQDGTLYWLRWEVRPWRRSDGAVGGIVIFAEDITARKLAEQELERAHHVLAEAQRISHLGSFEYDAATQHTVWSDEEYRIYGLDPAGPSPVYEAMLAQCIHPDDAAQLHQSFSAALASRSVYELEHRIVRPDGSVRWVYDLAHPYYDADGELVRYIGTTLDITERKQAELELRRYQQIVETSSEMLIFLDRDLRYRVVNPAYATLRHSTPADLQGRLAREVVGAEDYANIGPHLESALTGQAQRFCGSITAADGKHRYLDSDVRPFRGHDGTVLGVVVSIHDVTEAREAQLALQDQQARLADLVAARTAELQASETKLRTIYDLLPIGIAVTDRAGQIIDCNRAAEVMLGIAREEHFRRTYDGEEWAIIRPDGTPMPSSEYASVRALRESRLVGEIEMGVQRPAGVIWLSVSAMPTQHPEYGVVVAFVDVTARKTVEQTIRRYEQIVRSSVDAIYSTTLDGRIDSWNPAAETIYGYRAEEMLGQPLARLLLPDAFDEAAEIIRRVAQGETLGAFEVQHRGKDGRAIEISLTVSPIRDAAGRVVGVAKVACDIGERKRAEAQLRRLTERLQLATEAGGIGVWEWDVVEDRLIWDEQMYALYGVREQDFSGAYAAWVQGLHPEDAAQAQAEIERALHGQQTFRPEFRVRWPDGTVRDIAAFGKVVRDAAGVPQRMVGVNWDITEAKQARALAEQATRLKSEFLVNMSHEIRTPMNAVLGFTYLLERRPLDPAARDLVLKVRNAGRSLLTLINDILDFSKIEAGRLELESAPFRLTGLLDDLAAIMTAAARDKPLELIITPHPVRGYDALIGDAGRLQQVLINLLGNAIKFTEQGEVELRIDLESAAESDVRLRFAVRDTGIGISADQQAQIFAPFRQADSSISRRFGGTGLGLAISRQLVALLGGELRVESVPGEGSEFWFVLPLRGDPAAASASAPPELAGLHLLVADDSATAGAALVNTAAALGWTADLVTSGAAALGLAQARLEQPGFYDALLLDWQMPGQDGLATAALIREALRERMEASREPPVVIMVTAYARDALLDEPGMAVVDALLSKPVTPSALYHAIGEALSRRRPGLGLGRGLALTLPTGAQTPRLAGVRLLVVDDSDINREVAQQILQEEGASVHLAEDGQEALDWLADHPHEVDIVLMDVQMPRLDGYAATRRIRADARWQELPVLALTAGAYKELREAALAAGMNDFIAKPIQVEEAIALIQHWTGHRSAPVATALAVDPAGETPTAAVSAIDVASALQQWRTLESYRTYLDTFVARYADAGLTIATLCQDGDRAAAAALAHKLVGVAGSLALPRVLDLTRQLDRRLKGEEPIAELTMALQTAIDEVCAGIKAGIGTGIDAGIDVGLAPEGPAAAPRVDPDPDPGSVDLRALLDRFLDALDQHDPDLCESLLAQLSGRMAAEPLAAVQSRLTEFDFLGAEALTRALRRDLNRST